MPGTAAVSVEEYLKTPYEREPEYVHGELIERPIPTKVHARLAALLARRLPESVYVYIEFRMRLVDDVFRSPDLTIFTEEPEDFPVHPPFVTIEITSPDDKISEVIEKCEEYRTWGVEHIWVIETRVRKFYEYTAGLSERDEFELPAPGFKITAQSLFDEVFSGR